MKKAIALFCALALAASACGGDSASCDTIADDAIVLIQDLIDEFDQLSLDDLNAAEEPAFVAEFETDAEQLDERAADAGCTDATMEGLMDDRIDRLESTGLIGEALIAQLQEDGFGSFTE
ncbi:MAG: hypothetical protein KJP12_05615 [Acidimicrobiia bacterium]|nr:hypothetical protein [Acidimicrobiia bacterium]MBT8214686.1 hypothetical protein [Acidimicrobiia bacterium]NNF70167.1 hypothetical protein [Acidimicrobiia bacterium]NNK90999.1 hypothetical protein [Acidimicrobiia bacterium]